MRNRVPFPVLLLAWLIAAAGCAPDGSGPHDAGVDGRNAVAPDDPGADAGDAAGDPGVVDPVGDADVDPGPFDPMSWCAAPDAVAAASDLLPRPWRMMARPDAVWAGTVVRFQPALTGGDASDHAFLERILAEAGVAGRSSMRVASGLSIVVHPPSEWAGVVDACAPGLPDSDEAYWLRLESQAPQDGILRIDLFAPGPSGRRMAWRTIRQILLGTPIPSGVATIADAPATAMRGVIETFYGPPWEPDARIALMPTLAAMKYNTFIYASKMDLFTNWVFDYWKDGWEPVHLAELAAIADAARANGLLPGLQVRPLAAVTFSSQDDRLAFVDRVGELLDAGFDLFSLSFDDTDRVLGAEDAAAFESYDHAVIDFAAAVLAQLHDARPGLVLGFVPNDYWSDAPTAQATLTLAGNALPDYVTIGWTGRQIIPATVTAQDADQAAAWMKRRPLLGDNYPVLDHAGADLFLGPLEGRAADLPAHVAGLLFNPMPYPFASLPGLATCADYAWNAAAYDPSDSVQAMATFLAGPGAAADALAVMADVNRSPTIGGSTAPGLQSAIAAFRAAYDGGFGLADAADALEAGFFASFADVASAWPSVRDPRLRDELAPWAAQLGRYGAAGATALDLLAAKAAGGPVDPGALADWRAAVAQARSLTPRPTSAVMQDLLDFAERELVPVP